MAAVLAPNQVWRLALVSSVGGPARPEPAAFFVWPNRPRALNRPQPGNFIKIERPAAPSACMPRCRPRFGLAVASATPSAAACRTPCLHAPDCAGPGANCVLPAKMKIVIRFSLCMIINMMPLNPHEISGLGAFFVHSFQAQIAAAQSRHGVHRIKP